MSEVARLAAVTVVREGRTILGPINWNVQSGQRWVILGPNGAGKTTLLSILAGQLHPTAGTASVLGEQIGRTDLFELRPRIGFAANTQQARLPLNERVGDAVLTAAYGVSGRWNERYEQVDLERAASVLATWNLADKAMRIIRDLSDGERKRVQLARAMMADPELLLLDEPVASLDVGAREEFITLLSTFAAQPTSPAMVMVTHHLEEIPPGFTHAMLLRGGQVVSAGPIAETITSSTLTDTFGIQLQLAVNEGRYVAWTPR